MECFWTFCTTADRKLNTKLHNLVKAAINYTSKKKKREINSPDSIIRLS